MTDKQNLAQQANATREQDSGNDFVLRPFIQTPDAEIKIDNRVPEATRWAEKWCRRCGNPATSIIDAT